MDDDDEEGRPAPPTASDDGGRGPAYSFDVDEPPPPPAATKDAPAPPSDSDDSSEGWPEPAATPAMPSKAPPRRLDTIRSDDGSDDSGDAWPDAKPVSGGYGHDDTAEGVVGITAPTGRDDDDSDSGDDWGAPSREASSSTAPVAQTSGEIHTIDDWDDEAPAPAPPKLSPLDAAVAARRAAIETDSDSEGWPSPTAGKAPAAADMDDGSDDSDIESAVEQRKDSWPSDDESEDARGGGILAVSDVIAPAPRLEARSRRRRRGPCDWHRHQARAILAQTVGRLGLEGREARGPLARRRGHPGNRARRRAGGGGGALAVVGLAARRSAKNAARAPKKAAGAARSASSSPKLAARAPEARLGRRGRTSSSASSRPHILRHVRADRHRQAREERHISMAWRCRRPHAGRRRARA